MTQHTESRLQQIRRGRVTDEIAQQIRQLIIEGGYLPGDQLPPERRLSELLGVGRTSVREGLRSLEAVGLLTIKHGQGTFVRSPEIHNLLRPVTQAMHVDRKTVLEVMSLREMIEKESVKVAALRRTEEHLDVLRRCVEGMLENLADLDLFVYHDSKFHLTLMEAAGNKTALDMYEVLYQVLAKSAPWRDSLSDGSRESDGEDSTPYDETAVTAGNALISRLENVDATMPQAHLCHKRILGAVEDQNPELASNWMMIHLGEVRQAIENGAPSGGE